ncbi:MAG: MFS transporter [Bryobacteraceae bacterium]|nr:MFS transporter [Bryobacteraceae bacterium]
MGLTPHEFSGRFWAVVASTFLGFIGMGAVLPALGPHVRHDLGGTDQTVGFVIGTFSLVALISRFASGPIADRRGRKVAFIAGLSSCAAAGVVYLLPLGIAGAYLGRVLQGFGEACLYTGAAAWVIELGGIHRSAQALGYLSSGIWGGISLGPVLGQALGSFPRAAALQVVSALVGIACLWFVREDYEPHDEPRQGPWIPRGLILPGLTIGFVNVHYPVLTGFLVLHLAGTGHAGPLAFTAYALVILCSRFFLGGLPDRIAPHLTFYLGLVCMAVGLLGITFAPSAWLAVVATGVLGLGFSFPWSAVAATVLRRTPERERGSVVSVLSAFYDFFVGVSSFAAGMMAKRWGYPSAFLLAACAVGVAAILGRYVFAARAQAETLELAEVSR